jgi:hypothetical protein
MMMRFAIAIFLILVATGVYGTAAESNLKSEEVYQGWLQMYDLKFEDAHHTFGRWMETHPDDPLGPVSDAAAYLFSELARLEVLESELFATDTNFLNRKQLVPDVKARQHFAERIERADRLADAALQKSRRDAAALFTKVLVFGLRADYATLIDKQGFKGLSYTKAGRAFAERLLLVDPQAYDAYLGSGVENYVLSLKSFPLRFLLQITGSHTDRQTGLQDLRKTAEHGYYLEPFAKLLLGVAALRDNQIDKVREILTELHGRFPDNPLYTKELKRFSSEKSEAAVQSPPR